MIILPQVKDDSEASVRHGARAPSDFGSDLAGFSADELTAMNKVLMAILHAKRFEDLLHQMCVALSILYPLNGCALYRNSEDDRGLQIAHGVGDFGAYIPDTILRGSTLYSCIKNRKAIAISDSAPSQPSLFEDHPTALYCPIIVDECLVGALVAVHLATDNRFINVVLNEAAIALELLYKADSVTNSLSIRAHFAEESWTKCDELYAKLTAREKEVLSLLITGLSNKEIASKLCISSATCKHHVENILCKLNVHNRAAAVAIGLAHVYDQP